MATVNLIESYYVDVVVFNIKFEQSVKVSSITNDHFSLWTNEATPQLVSSDPFEDIDVSVDYDSIARRIHLRWKSDSLSPSTSYSLVLSGFRNLVGETIDDESIDFHTSAGESSATPPYNLTEPDPVSIVDFSIIPDAFTITDSLGDPETTTTTTKFAVIDTDPINFDAFLPSDYKSGVITIKFNANPLPEQLTPDYFFVEQKLIQRAPARWQTIPVHITADDTRPWVYIHLPSNDATPVYDTTGAIYYDTNYKYRIRISKDLGT